MHYSILKGPLGSHLNYITHIALENYQDYFEYTNRQKELGKKQENRKYQGFRLFLNAIESMNNISDYFYYEFKEVCNWTDKGNIIGKIRNNHRILKDIAHIANAYKHCRTNNNSNIHASDLQNSTLDTNVNLTSMDIKVKQGFTSIEDEKLLGEAFAFWVKYLNDPQPDFLLQDVELTKNISGNDNYDIADNVVNLVSQSIGNVIRESEKLAERSAKEKVKNGI